MNFHELHLYGSFANDFDLYQFLDGQFWHLVQQVVILGWDGMDQGRAILALKVSGI